MQEKNFKVNFVLVVVPVLIFKGLYYRHDDDKDDYDNLGRWQWPWRLWRGVDDEDETDYNWLASQYLPNFLEALIWCLRYICMEFHKSLFIC